MSSVEFQSEILPARRSDLVIRALGEEGRYVVKDPRTSAYFQFGTEEHFLLAHLDGRQTASPRLSSGNSANRWARRISRSSSSWPGSGDSSKVQKAKCEMRNVWLTTDSVFRIP